jgi:hypothetical protein
MHLGWNQVFNHVADVKKQWLEEKKVRVPFYFLPQALLNNTIRNPDTKL